MSLSKNIKSSYGNVKSYLKPNIKGMKDEWAILKSEILLNLKSDNLSKNIKSATKFREYRKNKNVFTNPQQVIDKIMSSPVKGEKRTIDFKETAEFLAFDMGIGILLNKIKGYGKGKIYDGVHSLIFSKVDEIGCLE